MAAAIAPRRSEGCIHTSYTEAFRTVPLQAGGSIRRSSTILSKDSHGEQLLSWRLSSGALHCGRFIQTACWKLFRHYIIWLGKCQDKIFFQRTL